MHEYLNQGCQFIYQYGQLKSVEKRVREVFALMSMYVE